MPLPDRLEIRPLSHVPRLAVRVPGSKSITNRALVLAALTGGCRLEAVLESEDTEVMVDCLARLGLQVSADWTQEAVEVRKPANSGLIPATSADLQVANSGTTMRFVTAMVALGQGEYRLDGVARMRERPIADLLAALSEAGVVARSETNNGCPPVIVEGKGLRGGTIRVKGDVSSQFLSGLLMASPFADAETTIEVQGTLVSIPYVAMTTAMMRQFGLQVETVGDHRAFRIPGKQRGGLRTYTIEPDASAASYFLGAAAVTGGEIAVEGLSRDSLQGDVRFAEVLGQMGCEVKYETNCIVVHGRTLHGIDVDMNDISDTVMTLGAVACFADGPTTIRNVGHIRHKETDRLTALATELVRVGAEVHLHDDGLTIVPRPLHGAEIETYKDHRMAMSLALVGLRVPGVVILDPGCVGKTYPRFFDDLAKL